MVSSVVIRVTRDRTLPQDRCQSRLLQQAVQCIGPLDAMIGRAPAHSIIR